MIIIISLWYYFSARINRVTLSHYNATIMLLFIYSGGIVVDFFSTMWNHETGEREQLDTTGAVELIQNSNNNYGTIGS